MYDRLKANDGKHSRAEGDHPYEDQNDELEQVVAERLLVGRRLVRLRVGLKDQWHLRWQAAIEWPRHIGELSGE